MRTAPQAIRSSRRSASASGSPARRRCSASMTALQSGRCLGLVGRNGAGKSTLVSILCGLRAADSGEVRFDGEPAPPMAEIGAWRNGSRPFSSIRWRRATDGCREHLPPRAAWPAAASSTGVTCAPRPAASCTSGTSTSTPTPNAARSRSSSARSSRSQARLPEEHASFCWMSRPRHSNARGAPAFRRVRALVAGGVAVLYISHHLEEVFEICDDVVVLRDGEVVLGRSDPGVDPQINSSVRWSGISRRPRPLRGLPFRLRVAGARRSRRSDSSSATSSRGPGADRCSAPPWSCTPVSALVSPGCWEPAWQRSGG